MASKKKGRKRLPSRKGTLKRLEKAMNALAKEKTGISFTEARKARKPRGTSRKGKGKSKGGRKSKAGTVYMSKSSNRSGKARGRKRDSRGRFV